MSADDLWLVRHHADRFWPIHTFASPLVAGEPLVARPLNGDPEFADLSDAISWCEEQEVEEPTEYGVILDTPRGLQQLRMLKERDQQEVRSVMSAFADRLREKMIGAEPGQHPLPGNHLADGIVIASVSYREAGDDTIPENMRDEHHNTDLYTILLLNDEPPYYTVGVGYWDGGQWNWDGQPVDHMNIVPAVNGEKYLGNESNRTGKSGYTDMGGDY